MHELCKQVECPISCIFFTLVQPTTRNGCKVCREERGRRKGNVQARRNMSCLIHETLKMGICAYLLLMATKSTVLEKVVYHILFLLLNSQVHTRVTIVVYIKLLLTKFGKEVLHYFQVALQSSKVEGIATILLV